MEEIRLRCTLIYEYNIRDQFVLLIIRGTARITREYFDIAKMKKAKKKFA